MSSLLWSGFPFSLALIAAALISWKGKVDSHKKVAWVDPLLFFAVYYQIAVLGAYTWVRGTWPLDSLAEVLLMSAWLIALAQWVSQRFAPTTSLAYISLSPALLITASAYLMGGLSWQNPSTQSLLFQIHLLISTAATAVFGVGVAFACMQLLLEKRLRLKIFDELFHRLPPLQKVEHMSLMWHSLGLFLCVLAFGSGYLWLKEVERPFLPSQILSSLLPIVSYGLPLLGAKLGFLRGRALALSLVGAAALFTLNILVKTL